MAHGPTCTVKAIYSLLCALWFARTAQGIFTETQRLRTGQKPNLCEQSVDACVRGRKMVPRDAVRLATLSDLTIPLRRWHAPMRWGVGRLARVVQRSHYLVL